MAQFRFQDLEIGKDSIEMASQLFCIADRLEAKKLFRFAEQLRGAALSISNNIAEGSGSSSKKDFANFLNFAHRSIYENANMIIIFSKCNFLPMHETTRLLDGLEILSRRITRFQRSL